MHKHVNVNQVFVYNNIVIVHIHLQVNIVIM